MTNDVLDDSLHGPRHLWLSIQCRAAQVEELSEGVRRLSCWGECWGRQQGDDERSWTGGHGAKQRPCAWDSWVGVAVPLRELSEALTTMAAFGASASTSVREALLCARRCTPAHASVSSAPASWASMPTTPRRMTWAHAARLRARRGMGRGARATAMTALAEEKRESEAFEAGDDDLCDPERVRARSRSTDLQCNAECGRPQSRGDGPGGSGVWMLCTNSASPRLKRGATLDARPIRVIGSARRPLGRIELWAMRVVRARIRYARAFAWAASAAGGLLAQGH